MNPGAEQGPRQMTKPDKIEIRLLGEPRIVINGARVELPQSRKTRALLAYLVTTRKRQRRDHLCSLLWELPSDPRAALRWSLSKIKKLLGKDGDRIVAADREHVELLCNDLYVDVFEFEKIHDQNLELSPPEKILSMVDEMSAPFILGLDLHNDPDFYNWCLVERERFRRMQVHMCETALQLDCLDRDGKIKVARTLTELKPESHEYRRLVSDLLDTPDSTHPAPAARETCDHSPIALSQKIMFCKARDNTRIAWSTTGSGPAILKASNWLNHLEFDWESPIWKHLIEFLAHDNKLIRYDQRCTGLSDWDSPDISGDLCVDDLEMVADACGEEKYTLLGISQGAAFSIAYAARHPERVSKIILIGGFASGWEHRGLPQSTLDEIEAMNDMVCKGWGSDTPAYRQMFTSLYIPDASRSEMDWFNEMQKKSASPGNARKIKKFLSEIDYAHLLEKIDVPVLVLHAAGDTAVPISCGKEIAAGVSNARFVTLPSNNHLVLEHEPAWPQVMEEISRFLDEYPDQ